MAAALLETSGQLIGKNLRPALWIIIAQKIGESEHGIEDERRFLGWCAPVGSIRGKQKLEPAILKVLVQNIADGELQKGIQDLVGSALEVVEQAAHVGLFHIQEELLKRRSLRWEQDFQLGTIIRQICRHPEAGVVREMEVVDRIHLGPVAGDADVSDEFAREGTRVAQEGIEVTGGIEHKTLSPKRAAETAYHVVTFHQQHLVEGP